MSTIASLNKVLKCSMIFLGVVSSTAMASTPLEVISLYPQPNYPLTTDSGDAAQLVDGVLTNWAYWTNINSVGWKRSSPVLIALTAQLEEAAPYMLEIRTGQRVKADVKVPRRVDVYCGAGPDLTAQHVGEVVFNSLPDEYDGIFNLSGPFSGCRGGVLQIIVHGQGTYIMIDEITVKPADAGTVPPALEGAPEITDVVADSLSRLELQLKANAALEEFQQRVMQLEGPASLAWLHSPWTDLTSLPGTNRLRLQGLSMVRPAFALGIANRSDETRRYTLAWSDDPIKAPVIRFLSQIPSVSTSHLLDTVIQSAMASTENISELGRQISRLPMIQAADGRPVFDAMEPQTSGTWTLAPGELIYFLVQEPAATSDGLTSVVVSDDAGWEQTLQVERVLYSRIQPEPSDNPMVILWSYTTDTPIWRSDNTDALMQALKSAGVNVFVIPPGNLLLPFLTSDSDRNSRMRKMADQAVLYRGRGLTLLFLGPSTWGSIRASLDDPVKKDELKVWINEVAEIMSLHGIPMNQWALYPVDEPRNDDLLDLVKLVGVLREAQPGLQFYANPLMGGGETLLRPSTIKQLSPLINYWQPAYGEAFDLVRASLGSDAVGSLWFYDNPCEPAKAVEPNWYREMGNRAFEKGSTGFGFWSFSSTSRSSAWSDSDHAVPDYAVVYEAEGGAFVSSRRWEGFKRGVRDYTALRFCARRAASDSDLALECDAYQQSLPRQISCHDWRSQ